MSEQDETKPAEDDEYPEDDQPTETGPVWTGEWWERGEYPG